MINRAFLVLLIAAVAMTVAAYDHPLGSSAIREAYFIGTDNHRSAEFLARYAKTFTPPNGNYVSQMEVRTPFAQVVANSRDHSVGYSAQQAEQDYRKGASTVQVRVQILFGPLNSPANFTNSPPGCQGAQRMAAPLDCFRGFHFGFRQGREIVPMQTYGVPIYSVGDGSVLIGGDLWFGLKSADVASAPLRVTVTTPDAQKISADFDLARLR